MNLASPSTITTDSFVPEIIISMSDSSSCVFVGLIISSPLIRPTVMDATGPSHGISEIAREAEAPSVPSISPLFSPSNESTLMKI